MASLTFRGEVSDNMAVAGNYDPAQVPVAGDDISIASSAENQPNWSTLPSLAYGNMQNEYAGTHTLSGDYSFANVLLAGAGVVVAGTLKLSGTLSVASGAELSTLAISALGGGSSGEAIAPRRIMLFGGNCK